MTEERIRVEGPPEMLLGLWDEIVDEMGDEVEVEQVAKSAPGELREPWVVALIITSSPVAIKTLGSLIERCMTHFERKDLLRVYREKDRQEITVKDLLDQFKP